jgi:DUF218 domain
MPDPILQSCIQKLKAICVLSGSIKKAQDTAHLGLGWRSLRGAEEDKTGGRPSYEVVLAAAVLWQMNPRLKLVLSGGIDPSEMQPGQPQISTVMAAEIVSLGIDPNAIIEESEGINTWMQLVECANVSRMNGWSADEVGVCSFIWHFGRITAMLCQGDEIANLSPIDPSVTPLISAERVLMGHDPEKWRVYFTELYEHPAMHRTMVSEVLGTGQLWAGHQPKHPEPFRGFPDPLGH